MRAKLATILLVCVAAPIGAQRPAAPTARVAAHRAVPPSVLTLRLERRSSVRTRYTLIGIATGAAFGAGVLLVQCSSHCGEGSNARAFAPLFIAGGAGVGGIVGFLAGSAVDAGRREQER